MYCMNCGANNNEDAAFCIQCGKQLGTFVPPNEKQKKKSKGLFVVLISAVLICAIVIVSVFDLWPWSRGKENAADRMQAENTTGSAQMTSENGVVTFEHFSLDAIVAQCPDCAAAIETYIEIVGAGGDWLTSTEDLEALEQQKHAQMQHFCTAEAIYVEAIPYSYRGSFGSYTGEWIGAGPAGKGSYIGKVYGESIVSYIGDWKFGLPDGAGELYVEHYSADFDMTYRGQMKNGKRDGWGSMTETAVAEYRKMPFFRIYDEAFYVQDQLPEFVDCVQYDAKTGDIMEYCQIKTDEEGLTIKGNSWGPNDLSPEQEKALSIAAVVFAFGYIGYLTYGAITIGDDWDQGASNQRVLEMTNRLREQADANIKARDEALEMEKKNWALGELKAMDANPESYDRDFEKKLEGIYYGN